ncbi:MULTISPECIES: GNAT family N-acetyltransferase [Microbacterium]|uniref:GNAT family N-acetyltransferase n=1 Tax=Microbacterium TaxID=33882 RepID=UPI0011EB0DE4|nr:MULTISPECIES: GNAT family N-acetyltransferase [Microbacterium]
MAGVTVRTMTADEFDEWMGEVARAYAHEQVAAGRWPADGAMERARSDNARMLPQGPNTPRMLVLRGLDAGGRAIGRAWVGLDHPRGAPGVAFLYDIEVEAGRRGEGLGRGLLAAVEGAARAAGATALELNVFGGNRPAIRMYETAGYEVVTQQMRKPL